MKNALNFPPMPDKMINEQIKTYIYKNFMGSVLKFNKNVIKIHRVKIMLSIPEYEKGIKAMPEI